MPDDILAALNGHIDAALPELFAMRRQVHAHPELARRENDTCATIERHLRDAGVKDFTRWGTALIVNLGAEQPAYRVALRADIDALPVSERADVPFASTVAGVAHACGHDLHLAALTGAVAALHDQEQALRELGVAVRAIFQPAEEVMPGGALELIDRGVLDDVDVIYAVHCDPSLEVGQVGLREGALTSACDDIVVTLSGRGGHTSRPQLTEDLTFALAKVVTDVPAALSRRIDPRAGAALVWGIVHAGAASNVIPSTGMCRGTLRMLDATAWRGIEPLLAEIVAGVVAPYAVQATLERTEGVPPVVNHPDAVEALRRSAIGTGAGVAGTSQSLGGEDFAWYSITVPAAMARLGTRTPGGRIYDLHQGDVIFAEEAIGVGAKLLAAAVVTHRVKVDLHEMKQPDVGAT